MKLIPSFLTFVAAGLLLPGIAAAHPYTYLDGGVLDREDSDLGVRLGASAGLTPPVALFGEIVDADEYEQLSAGALFHTPLTMETDFIAGLSMEAVDAGREDDVGLGVRAGMRWFVPETRGFELNPEIRQVWVFNDAITSVRANALFPVTPELHLQGALQAGDDDRVEFGMRYNFGTRDSAQRSY